MRFTFTLFSLIGLSRYPSARIINSVNYKEEAIYHHPLSSSLQWFYRENFRSQIIINYNWHWHNYDWFQPSMNFSIDRELSDVKLDDNQKWNLQRNQSPPTQRPTLPALINHLNRLNCFQLSLYVQKIFRWSIITGGGKVLNYFPTILEMGQRCECFWTF